jgi:hypothetical protein
MMRNSICASARAQAVQFYAIGLAISHPFVRRRVKIETISIFFHPFIRSFDAIHPFARHSCDHKNRLSHPFIRRRSSVIM